MSQRTTFAEIVPEAGLLVGVKAVVGPLTGRSICFASHGDAVLKDKGHFQGARNTAEKEVDRPWLITIGGGADCPPELAGRVLNIARLSKLYGETNAFYPDAGDHIRLAQWPVATALLDVWEVDDMPYLVNDLRLADRSILANAYDIVVRPPEKIDELWEALSEHSLSLLELPALPNYREPDTIKQVGTLLPTVISKEDGREISTEVQRFERDSALAKAKRDENAAQNGGILVCEACTFSDEQVGMFDVHHLVPLTFGQRTTTLTDLAVLCPLCHRWAHRKGAGQLKPLSLAELIKARR